MYLGKIGKAAVWLHLSKVGFILGRRVLSCKCVIYGLCWIHIEFADKDCNFIFGGQDEADNSGE
jgi:hypothetical protein